MTGEHPPRHQAAPDDRGRRRHLRQRHDPRRQDRDRPPLRRRLVGLDHPERRAVHDGHDRGPAAPLSAARTRTDGRTGLSDLIELAPDYVGYDALRRDASSTLRGHSGGYARTTRSVGRGIPTRSVGTSGLNGDGRRRATPARIECRTRAPDRRGRDRVERDDLVDPEPRRAELAASARPSDRGGPPSRGCRDRSSAGRPPSPMPSRIDGSRPSSQSRPWGRGG